ncbi:MAG: T9SS type A sorting domain-containing protein [Saprospiraceae bacterium]
MKIFIIIALLTVSIQTLAQHEGDAWLMGYSGGILPNLPEEKYGLVVLNFNKPPYPLLLRKLMDYIDPDQNRVSICDTNQNMTIIFEGISLFNKNYKVMKGGDTVNFNKLYFKAHDEKVRQSALLLPFPSQRSKYILLHSQTEYFNIDKPFPDVGTMRIFMSVIDLEKDNGLGAVTTKKKIVLSDTLVYGQIAGAKHANGRDWWVITQELYTNKFYKILVDPTGANVYSTQRIGTNISGGVGQAVFSADGNTYANLNGDRGEVYDFDRCSGELSNFRAIKQADNDALGVGIAISPNSRFLYAALYTNLYQYDLYASDLEASKTLIAAWDGYKNEFGLTSHFNMAQLAPNGKIYITCAGAIQFLHVINDPDEKGSACNFVQRGLELPSYHSWGVPNHPNFALGALKGSPCDTLHSIAVKEKENSLQATLFPNPTSDQVTIKWQNDQNEACEIVIIDAVGRIIQRQESHASSLIIDTASWANGLYYVQIVEEKGRKKAFLKMAKSN